MAEVRNFSSYKKNKQTPKEEEETGFEEIPYIEKIRSHKLMIFYRTVLFSILAIAVVAIVYIQWKDKIYSEMKVLSTTGIENISSGNVAALGNDILLYSKDGISCINTKGEALWNQTYEMQSPKIRICKNIAAVGDNNGNEIYVAGTDGVLGEINTNLPIRDFCVAAQGVVAAVLDDTDVTWIKLYDATGNELATFKTTMKDSGYPEGIAISPNGEIVSISYLYAQDSNIRTSIAFYNFGSVGQNETDNYASGYDYQNVVAPYVKFMSNKISYAVSNDRIMFYAGEQVPQSQKENLFNDDEVKSVFSNEEYVGIVFPNSTNDGAYRLQVYNSSGSLILTKYFSIEYTNIAFVHDQFMIYNDSEIQICSMDGTDKFKGNFDDSVNAVISGTSRNRLTIVTDNSIEEIEMR